MMAPTLKPIVLTAALPYANGPLHVGHLVEYIQADIIARYYRLIGRDILFCCADDTHGTPIEVKAKQEGVTPETLIARYAKEHKEDFDAYLVSFDSYYSTNSPENNYFADLIFAKLKKNNLICTKDVELTYCEHDKRFLPDRFVKGECARCGAKDQYGDQCEHCGNTHNPTDLKNPYCTICNTKPTVKKSKHHFFKLSTFSDQLRDWLTTNKNLQKEIVNQQLTWIDQGLQDWCISRDGPYFGFKIPGEEDKYYYVWLDAPIGYISSLANALGRDVDKGLDRWNASDIIHVIGKDIVYFHYLFWPAILWGAGLNVPHTILTHGHLVVNGEKMSKSRGTFITARDFLKLVTPEHVRFHYASSLSRQMQDLNLDLKDYEAKINNELVANISNFVYRTLSFCNTKLDSKLTIVADKTQLAKWTASCRDTLDLYGKYELREAVKKILSISQEGNAYMQTKQPWKQDAKEANETITLLANLIKNLAIVLKPVLPFFAEKVEKQLGLGALTANDLDTVIENRTINKAEIIYQKIEPITIAEDPFSALALKVGKILSVENHPNADKLYVLRVDIGKETRQLCAGIKTYYTPDQLLGRNVVVLSNLKPAMLRGVESQGMVLAAELAGAVKLLGAHHSEPGDHVGIGDITAGKSQITIEDFQKITLTTKDKNAVYGGKPLKTAHETVSVDIVDGAKIR